jgi:hypothetical protein
MCRVCVCAYVYEWTWADKQGRLGAQTWLSLSPSFFLPLQDRVDSCSSFQPSLSLVTTFHTVDSFPLLTSLLTLTHVNNGVYQTLYILGRSQLRRNHLFLFGRGPVGTLTLPQPSFVDTLTKKKKKKKKTNERIKKYATVRVAMLLTTDTLLLLFNDNSNNNSNNNNQPSGR